MIDTEVKRPEEMEHPASRPQSLARAVNVRVPIVNLGARRDSDRIPRSIRPNGDPSEIMLWGVSSAE